MSKNQTHTGIVFITTLVGAVLEIYFGNKLQSYALMTEGSHMMLHAIIVGVGFGVYFFRKHNAVSLLNLSAFNLSIVLFIFTVGTFIRSFRGLFTETTQVLDYGLAIKIALLGLSIHLINFFFLQHHDHHHTPDENCKDHNIKAIYLHVLADLFTAIMTVLGLSLGYYFSFAKADSIAGLISSSIVIYWAIKLIQKTLIKLKA